MENYSVKFQAIQKGLSKKELVLHFLEHLKQTHPLPSGLSMSVNCLNKKLDKGKSTGQVKMSKVNQTAEITIFEVENREPLCLLNTVAHEYKHILQSFVEYPDKWVGGKVKNMKEEVEACVFGSLQSRKFCL